MELMKGVFDAKLCKLYLLNTESEGKNNNSTPAHLHKTNDLPAMMVIVPGAVRS